MSTPRPDPAVPGNVLIERSCDRCGCVAEQSWSRGVARYYLRNRLRWRCAKCRGADSPPGGLFDPMFRQE